MYEIWILHLSRKPPQMLVSFTIKEMFHRVPEEKEQAMIVAARSGNRKRRHID